MPALIAEARSSNRVLALPNICLAEMAQNDLWASTFVASFRLLIESVDLVYCIDLPKLLRLETRRGLSATTLVDDVATNKLRALISASKSEAQVRAHVPARIAQAIEWARGYYMMPELKEWIVESVEWMRTKLAGTTEFERAKRSNATDEAQLAVAKYVFINKWSGEVHKAARSADFVSSSVLSRLFMSLSLQMVDSLANKGWVNLDLKDLRNDYVFDTWYIVLGSFASLLKTREPRVARLSKLTRQLACSFQ